GLPDRLAPRRGGRQKRGEVQLLGETNRAQHYNKRYAGRLAGSTVHGNQYPIVLPVPARSFPCHVNVGITASEESQIEDLPPPQLAGQSNSTASGRVFDDVFSHPGNDRPETEFIHSANQIANSA